MKTFTLDCYQHCLNNFYEAMNTIFMKPSFQQTNFFNDQPETIITKLSMVTKKQ